MPQSELKVKRDAKGRIVYTYRGRVERGTGGSYKWFDGYSATTEEGWILYPWMTPRECQRDAKAIGSIAVLEGN